MWATLDGCPLLKLFIQPRMDKAHDRGAYTPLLPLSRQEANCYGLCYYLGNISGFQATSHRCLSGSWKYPAYPP